MYLMRSMSRSCLEELEERILKGSLPSVKVVLDTLERSGEACDRQSFKGPGNHNPGRNVAAEINSIGRYRH